MPLFMDRHDLAGATAEDLAKAHILDEGVQEKFGVRYLSYWFDYERQAAFCLVDSPSPEAAEDVHRESHGLLANQIIEVKPEQVRAYLGRARDAPLGEPYVETAFRSILFTDIEGSTALTQRLGDAEAMQVLRRHDDIVREALRETEGNEVKHTGDGIMASFTSASRAVGCAIAIQKQLADDNSRQTEEALSVRIGLSAGEPVTDGGDLFGAVVQLAARLCAHAEPGGILTSTAVRDLSMGKGFVFIDQGEVALRGFEEPVRPYAVQWSMEAPEA
jgi:class 3 adenylate cyclase